MALTFAAIQAEFDDSPCVATLTQGQLDWLRVILAWKILSGDVPMTHDDIQTLFDDSPCIATLTPDQLAQIEVLLSQASGSGSVLTGNGAPVAPPSNQAGAAIYFDRVAGIFYGWNTVTLAWE
jgi:hypothetical protein